jgi:signal transduction histidine kinase
MERSAGRDPWSWLRQGTSNTEQLMRRVAWSATPVGPVETWSASLKSHVAMLLHSKHPMILMWGPQLVQFYNDGFVPSFGVGRHPEAMGQRGRECWAEVWDIVGSQIEGVMQRAEPTFHEDALIPIFRNGRIEEVYWTYGYSPVFEADGSVAGTLVVVTETTTRVLSARRMHTASVVSDAIAPVLDAAELHHAVLESLKCAEADFPWVLIYRTRSDGAVELVGCTGMNSEIAREVARLSIRQNSESSNPNIDISELDVSSISSSPIAGPGEVPYVRALALPVYNEARESSETMVFGLSPALPDDVEVRDHARGIARQLASAESRLGALRARLEAEVDRNNLLMQAPFAAALLVGAELRYELANGLYEEMVGRKVVGKEWRKIFPELIGGPVEAILEKVYQSGEPNFASEQYVPLVKEGLHEDRYFDFNMIPIRDPGGTVYAMMVVAVELTAQVRARQELEHTGREREKLLRELESANRAKDEFLAMLGHELRNPLSPIVTALDLMRFREDASHTQEREVIERQVAHLIRLVDDLLDISKVTRGKIELRRSISEVSNILSRAIEIASALFEQRNHELHIDVPEGLYWDGDATRLAQVIANLLTNAARYTPPSGRIDVAVSREEDTLVLRVRDNGRGIEPVLFTRLFTPFAQGERSVDRAEGGLGLGLALVKSLVALHGGTVEAHSEGLGKGSEFIVRVPGLVDRMPDEKVNISQLPKSDVSRKKVLVVDDNHDAALMLRSVLDGSGHEVATAHDGPSALALLDRFVPDVAVLDIGLPAMDGYELVGRLRKKLGAHPCLCIAVTGYGQASDAARAVRAGFHHHLVKPLDIRALEELLGD